MKQLMNHVIARLISMIRSVILFVLGMNWGIATAYPLFFGYEGDNQDYPTTLLSFKVGYSRAVPVLRLSRCYANDSIDRTLEALMHDIKHLPKRPLYPYAGQERRQRYKDNL